MDTPYTTLDTHPLLSGQEHAEIIFEGTLPLNHIAHAIRLRECTFEKAHLDSAKLIKFYASNTKLLGSSLAGTSLSECSLDSVTFANCRLTGTIFSEGLLEDCAFKDCLMSMALFRFSTLKNIRFIDCNLEKADFTEAKLKNVTFKNCNLDGVDFSHAKLSNVDLRGSQILNMRGISQLNGALISSDQLISLAHALAAEAGITVAD